MRIGMSRDRERIESEKSAKMIHKREGKDNITRRREEKRREKERKEKRGRVKVIPNICSSQY